MADSIYQYYPMLIIYVNPFFLFCAIITHNTTILNCVGFQRPLITQSPVSITRAAGQTAELKCEASGKPAPNFQWLKDGHDVAGSDGVTITTGNRHSTLTINNIQDSHAGQYMCRTSNFFSYQNDISCPATITFAGELSVPSLYTDLSTLKPSSQYDASRRKAPRRDATSCQNLPARRYNFAWHLLLLRQVVRRRSE